jgi:hypothetical protein
MIGRIAEIIWSENEIKRPVGCEVEVEVRREEKGSTSPETQAKGTYYHQQQGKTL